MDLVTAVYFFERGLFKHFCHNRWRKVRKRRAFLDQGAVLARETANILCPRSSVKPPTGLVKMSQGQCERFFSLKESRRGVPTRVEVWPKSQIVIKRVRVFKKISWISRKKSQVRPVRRGRVKFGHHDRVGKPFIPHEVRQTIRVKPSRDKHGHPRSIFFHFL